MQQHGDNTHVEQPTSLADMQHIQSSARNCPEFHTNDHSPLDSSSEMPFSSARGPGSNSDSASLKWKRWKCQFPLLACILKAVPFLLSLEDFSRSVLFDMLHQRFSFALYSFSLTPCFWPYVPPSSLELDPAWRRRLLLGMPSSLSHANLTMQSRLCSP